MLVSRREVAPVYLMDSATVGLFENAKNIFLTEAGDGTGTRNFNNNYSVTAKDIYYQAVTTFQLYSMQFSLTDAGQFAYDGYASNVALTNGVKFFLKPLAWQKCHYLTAWQLKPMLIMKPCVVNMTQQTGAGLLKQRLYIFIF